MQLFEKIERTTEDFFSREELENKIKEKKQLIIKYGVDLTAPFLHIGHAVNLWMMREFQNYGHKVVFLLGDFTTTIGDPTGKLSTRKIMTQEAIEKNAEEFIRQVSKVLDTREEVFEIRRNSEWYSKMSISELFSLFQMVTHSRLISRDMFKKRIESETDIYINELLYPIIQGYDSVMIKSDLTIVGSDQLFNEMMGKFYQKKFDLSEQVIITTKITNGLCGINKQSKSLGNYVAITDSARDMFGKVMSLPDKDITDWMRVYTDMSLADVEKIEADMDSKILSPRDSKINLGCEIVKRYYSQEEADQEKEWFITTFSKNEFPEDTPLINVSNMTDPLYQLIHSNIMKNSSSGEIRRLISQGAVSIDDNKIVDPYYKIPMMDDSTSDNQIFKIKIGKRRFYRIQAASC
ncbi:tyrosine--tRNA ligase [Fulvivirga sp. 29W222]|uniref:Tyrosine--tRNA ligase n=1 Tax=Fulvivirga marina TaxID=2494733 RepID=A0A937G0H7_9BACT|nr:tyrosine--tRNA ligase [Fulvivirga marina]MBL6448387.1 tyrosine--tRNA ligase [Fulvivirga marina]